MIKKIGYICIVLFFLFNEMSFGLNKITTYTTIDNQLGSGFLCTNLECYICPSNINPLSVSNMMLFMFFVLVVLNIILFLYLYKKKGRYQDDNVQKKTEEHLFAKENQLKTLVNNLPDFIYIKDTKSRFILANQKLAEVMLGKKHTPDELVGKTDHDCYDNELADQYLKDEQEIMQSGQPLIGREEQARDEDGNDIVVSSTKVPVKNLKGKVLGIVGIGRDITKLKQAEHKIRQQAENLQETNTLLEERQEEIQQQKEEIMAQRDELENLNNTKDKFFSIIGHDLKNPFNAIINLSDILKNSINTGTKEEMTEMIELIRISAKSAFELLENLLQWSKSQSGNIEFTPEKFDINTLIHKNIEFFKVNAEKKNIKLLADISGEVNVYADKNMINTVIRNIINNALKFTKPGGEINISSRQTQNEVEVQITDNGIGMDEEIKDNLFQLSSQRSTQGTSGEIGSGLGLILCKEFITKNHGEIIIDSQPGKGSTFIIKLDKPNNE
jgi:PAS domain S-box-containing protein